MEWWMIFAGIGVFAILAFLVLEVVPYVEQMMGDE